MPWGVRTSSWFAIALCLTGTAEGLSEAARLNSACHDGRSSPDYAPLHSAPNVRYLKNVPPESLAIPPACFGLSLPETESFVEVAATFQSTDDTLHLLSRMGKVSALLRVRYWSTTDHAWRKLLTAATALTPDGRAREDFASSDIEAGRDLYLSQTDSRSARAVVYRMSLEQEDARGFIVQIVNVSPVRWWMMTLYDPGALRTVYMVRRQSANVWTYYSVTSVGGGRWLVSGQQKSYVNRIVALYRHFTGIPTDEEPPPAP